MSLITSPQDISGHFSSITNGLRYELELNLSLEKRVSGSLHISTEVFELKGKALLPERSVYGVVLEPMTGQAFALFKAKWVAKHLVLKLDFPSYEPSNTQPRFLIFQRVPETWVQTKA